MANNNRSLLLESLNTHQSQLEMLLNRIFKKNYHLQLMLKLRRVVCQDSINHNLLIYAIAIQVQKMLVLLVTIKKIWMLAFGVTSQLPNTIEEDIRSIILFKLRNVQLEFGFEVIFLWAQMCNQLLASLSFSLYLSLSWRFTVKFQFLSCLHAWKCPFFVRLSSVNLGQLVSNFLGLFQAEFNQVTKISIKKLF